MATTNNARRSWLHNMSVPARSRLTCARAVLPGRRYLVDWLPTGMDGERASGWNAAIQDCLERHGMAALAVLVAYGSADPPNADGLGRLVGLFRGEPGNALSDWITAARTGCGPASARRVRHVARRFGGDADRCVTQAFDEALRGCGLPNRMGVFLPAHSLDRTTPRARIRRLSSLESLAVLARRCGPLYVPGRPIEPSLIRLNPCLLVLPPPGREIGTPSPLRPC
jgi:hypothetical protein